MVVIEVLREDVPEVALAQNNNVIQAIPPDAADQAFDVRILPRAARGGQNLLDADALDAPLEVVPVDRIA